MNNRINPLQGSLWRSVTAFIIPIVLGNFLQQMLNAADTAIVGRYVGSWALAAVGSTGPIAGLMINLFSGLSIGTNVVLAKYIGAERREAARRTIVTSLLSAIVIGVVLNLVGQILMPPITVWMSVPSNIMAPARLYLRIYFMGIPFMMIYNTGSAVLRSMGDSRRPLYCIMIAGVFNVLMNLTFVIGLGLGIAGVAAATVLANTLGALLVLRYIRIEFLHSSLASPEPLHIGIDRDIFLEVLRIGLPASVQGGVSSVSHLCLQSSINSFGGTVIAASSVAVNVENFVYYLMNSFNQASVTFIGQNLGAGQYKRCRDVTRTCLILGSLATMLFSAILIVCVGPIAGIYTKDPSVIPVVALRFRYVITLEFIDLMVEVMSGTMRGYGHSMAPAISYIFGKCGVRILWVYTAFRLLPSFEMLLLAYPVSWAVTLLMMVVFYLRLLRRQPWELAS